MDVSLVTALGLGLTLGLRHALDADHVAAVSTLVARERGLARSCLLGAFWGAGHTLALWAPASPSSGSSSRSPPGSRRRWSGSSALVLVLLGGHVLLRAFGGTLAHGHEHAHGGVTHRHAHAASGLAGRGARPPRPAGRPPLPGRAPPRAGRERRPHPPGPRDHPVPDRRARLHPGVRHRLDGGNAAPERARRAPGGAPGGAGAPAPGGDPGARRRRERGPRDLDARGPPLRAPPRPAPGRASIRARRAVRRAG